jgi:hypothetical protein
MTQACQALDQEDLHAREQNNQKYDGDLREPKKPGIGFFMLCIVHGRVALRSIDTHVASPRMVIFEFPCLVG